MKHKFKIYFLSLLFPLFAHSQVVDYVHVYGGARLFGGVETFNFETGLPNNVFADYSPSPVIGVTILRELTNNLSIGIGAEFANSMRRLDDSLNNNPSYNLNTNSVYTFLKYNLTRVERFMSPYILAGVSLNFVSIQQPRYKTVVTNPDPRKDQLTYLKESTFNRDYSSVLFIPTVGVFGGAGLDFKIREGYGLFVQYSYNFCLTADVIKLQKFYPQNEPQNLIYHNVTIGMRFFM
ncbi:MAG: hypothetical protein EAZ53_14700 [Bacteroidetes bacterium]|nr:MAG: hypothetical protein EAZ53_14700 [Bacteroidota bacterium]